MVDQLVETLRQKQKRVAREAILQATADEIAERGLGGLSLQDVAARAGVSIRTLYNYFENRDQLLRSVARWSDELTEQMGGWVQIRELDDLPEAVPKVWRSWEQQGTVYQAVVRIDAADSGPVSQELRAERRERTDRLIAEIARRRPDLPADEVEEIATFIHAVLGPVLWDRMRQLSGLTSERSGPVTTWVLRLILEALDRGDRPHPRAERAAEAPS